MHTQIDAVTADSRIQMQQEDAAESNYKHELAAATQATNKTTTKQLDDEYAVIEDLDAEHVLRAILHADESKQAGIIAEINEYLRHVAIERELFGNGVEYADMPNRPECLS